VWWSPWCRRHISARRSLSPGLVLRGQQCADSRPDSRHLLQPDGLLVLRCWLSPEIDPPLPAQFR